MANASKEAGFWANPNVLPKRAYKWTLSMPGLGIPDFVVSKVSKPSFTLGEASHKFINHTFYFPGSVTWSPVSVTLVDTVGAADPSQAMVDLLRLSGYEYPSTSADARNNQISRSAAIAALGTIEIRQYGLAPGPGDNLQVIEQWQLMNGWVKDVKFGDLSYDNDGLLNVDLTIRYDWAEKTL